MSNYCLAKLKFITPIHSGDGDLADTKNVFYADTLFSALCHEAVLTGGEEKLDKLVNLTNENKVKFSDLLPYLEGDYYLPKPILRIINNEDNDNDNKKKEFKKLKYIPVCRLEEYLNGNMTGGDAEFENNIIKEIGKGESKVSAAIKGLIETNPFSVGTFSFNPNSGLYFIISFCDEKNLNFIKDLIVSLSFSGLGGKKSAGLGKFDVEFLDVPNEILELMNSETASLYMTLSVGMCADNEIETIVDSSASYSLIKRGGFIYSENFADTNRKKEDFYVFAGGSCFSKKFEGVIADVSGGRGNHPVYRYAKPIFLGVNI